MLRLRLWVVCALLVLAPTLCRAQGRPDIEWMAGGHATIVNSLAFSPDGTRLISGAGDTWGIDWTVKVWNVTDSALVSTLALHSSDALSVAFSPDGGTFASGGRDKVIHLYRASDGALLRTLTGCTGGVGSIAFTPDGSTLVSGDYAGYVRYWRTSDGAGLGAYGRTDSYPTVAISPDGSTVATGWSNGRVRLFRMSDRTLLQTLTGHTGRVASVAFSPDSAVVASGSYDTSVKLWRASDGGPIRTITGHTGRIMSIAYAPDGQTVASGGDDGSVRISRVADGTLAGAIVQGDGTRVKSVAFAPGGAALAVGGENCSVTIRSVPDGALVAELTRHGSPARCVGFSPDSGTVASGSGTATNVVALRDCTVRLWRASDGALLHTLIGHTSPVMSVAFSMDGSVVASAGSYDQTVKLWRASDGALLNSLTHPTGVYAVAFSPDGVTLATGGGDKTIRLWRASDGAPLGTLAGHDGAVETLAYSPDGSTIVSGGADATVRLWRVSDGGLVRTITGHTGNVLSVAFSPDGASVVSSGADRTICLWRVSDGTLQRTITWSGLITYTAAFTPDGGFLVCGASYGGVSIWRVFDGALMWSYDQEMGTGVEGIAVARDGLHMALARLDATVVLARMPTADFRPNTASWAPDRAGSLDGLVTLKAYLWRTTDRQFLAAKPVTFSVDGTAVGSATTDAGGQSALGWTATLGPTTRTLRAEFVGDTEYRGCSTSAVLTVSRYPTQIYTVDRTGNGTEFVTLKGWLRRSDTSAFLEGKLLTFSVDGTDVASGVTDLGGQAAVNWRIAGWVTPGAHALTCAFAGDAAFAPSSAAATLTATQTATKMYMPDRAGRPYQVGSRAYLTAYLYRMDNRPVGNKTLQFQVDGTTVGSGVTNDPEVGGNGRAMFLWDIPVTFAAGVHAMRADFAGDNGYTASHTHASLTLDMGALYIWPYVRSVVQGEAWPLRAFVRTVPDYTWQPGLTIEFTLDPGPSQVSLGTAVTDASGIATLQAASAGVAVGTHTIRASYAGSPAVAPAQADTTATVVAP